MSGKVITYEMMCGVRGGDQASARASLRDELAAQVAAVGEHGLLTVVELVAEGVVIWQVSRNPNGTPRCRYWPPRPWHELAGGPDLARERNVAPELPRLGEKILPPTGLPVVIVLSPGGGRWAQEAFEELRKSVPATASFSYEDSLRGLLADVLAHDPLTQFYELVVLRRSSLGRPELALCQLFPPGAERGETARITIRCAPGDGQGTVFAVVAVAPGRAFRLVSVRSAHVPPGRYTLTAELRGPGQVCFKGLDESFADEERSWPELVTLLPKRLDPPQAAHLICLVETGGTKDEFEERLWRVMQLIEAAPVMHTSQAVSVLSYGPHAVGHSMTEDPLHAWAWAQSAKEALAEVDNLRERGVVRNGYPRAAQLECALTDLVSRLGSSKGRCVLVTVGVRPAFPARMDPKTEIIPCPRRHDWRDAVKLLRRHDITFGAILDRKADDDMWAQLASDALAYGAPVDVPGFAARLGLVGSATGHVPFPLTESEGD